MARSRAGVTGLKELSHVLEQMPDDIRDKAIHAGTKKGADHIRDIARSLAPVRTGKLRENIVTRKHRGTVFDAEHRIVIRAIGKAWNPKNAWYAHLVEFGTVNAPAQPFMRPAFHLGQIGALKLFKQQVTKRVKRFEKKRAKV